jgi:hypothetical protein
MNMELIASYLRFLLQTRGLQWALVKVRVRDIAHRRHDHRHVLPTKH